MNREAIVVLGMHRSGTSTTAGIFAQLGFRVGKSFMEGNETNPKGFFENYRLMFFNESLLHACHVNWHNTVCLPDKWWKQEDLIPLKEQLKSLISLEFGNEKMLLFKDPRLCILIPFYLDVFRELDIIPKFIITTRKPSDIALSLKRRDRFPLPKSIRIWMDHMLKAEHYSRGYPRFFIDYHDVLNKPLDFLHRALKIMRIDINVTPEMQERILDFIEPGLNHGDEKKNDFAIEFPKEAIEINELLWQLSTSGESDSIYSALDKSFRLFYDRWKQSHYPLVTVLTIATEDRKMLEETMFSVVGQLYPRIVFTVVADEENQQVRRLLETFFYLVTTTITTKEKTHGAALNHAVHAIEPGMVVILAPGERFIDENAIANLLGEGGSGDRVLVQRDSALKALSEEFCMKRQVNPDSLFKNYFLSDCLIPSEFLSKTSFITENRGRSEFAWLMNGLFNMEQFIFTGAGLTSTNESQLSIADTAEFKWRVRCLMKILHLTPYQRFRFLSRPGFLSVRHILRGF